ncbi:hypothetical protein Taro_048828 [Colocasia esculenta]|uniref:Uncharacterized protein n=1 Tax=Colocasia esculenta TaxID=4460 RepID=A0A843X964_COLES|nr:hypothetical protein [Colocasia esculenta]
MEEDVGFPPAGEKNVLAAAAAANSLCPMYFGASCAFMALHLLSKSSGPDLDSARRSHLGEALLQGSARLLGLLVWRLQRGREALEERLTTAETEVRELKRLRAEDAKANEKVAGIFASREHCWIAEKKRLRVETQALLSRFRMLEAQKEEAMSDSKSRIEEKDRVIRTKEAALEEEIRKRTELEERLRVAEAAAEETRERARKEAQDHAAELRRHRTAFAELVSNHRQLEAEMGRALRQVEAARRDLDEAFEQKDDAISMVEKLSDDIARMRRDAEQKGKVLSALLRKSKLDVAEKQVLLKEVRTAKAREKAAELELGKLRHRNGPHAPHFVEAGSSHDRREEYSLASRGGFHHHRALLLDHLQAEGIKNGELTTPERGSTIAGSDSLDQCSIKDSEELDIRELQDWVRSEIEKCTHILQQRHYAEVEAFTEQMRLKDEKLDAFRWRALSMELESKRLHAHVEGLDRDLSRYREECIKLEALLQEKEQDLKSLREELGLQMRQCPVSSPSPSGVPPFDSQALWSEVRIVERDAGERWPELEAGSGESVPLVLESLIQEGGGRKADGGAEQTLSESEHDEDSGGWEEPDPATASSAPASAPCTDQQEIQAVQCIEDCKRGERASEHPEQGMVLETSQAPPKAAEEERDVSVDPSHAQLSPIKPGVPDVINKAQASGQPASCSSRGSPWKVDLHALGISYKIKRLKQQLLVLEKLAGHQEPDEKAPAEHERQTKTLLQVISLLDKQVKRYESLEEKADELCKRMVRTLPSSAHQNIRFHRSNKPSNRAKNLKQESKREDRSPSVGRSKDQTEALEGFLEEAFQLQRHIVATGQKLVGVESQLADSAVDEGGHPPAFDAGQFAKVARTLFREIQRGFEVRVARMIGSLEGTLAREGILHISS